MKKYTRYFQDEPVYLETNNYLSTSTGLVTMSPELEKAVIERMTMKETQKKEDTKTVDPKFEEYYGNYIKHLNWRFKSVECKSKIITTISIFSLIVSLAFTGFGLYLSYKQFVFNTNPVDTSININNQSMNDNKKQINGQNKQLVENQQTSIELLNTISIKSNIYGIIIFVIALLFFYLFVKMFLKYFEKPPIILGVKESEINEIKIEKT